MTPPSSTRSFAVNAIIGFALCVMIYHQAYTLAPLSKHCQMTFLHPKLTMDFMVIKTRLGTMDLRRSWSPRILSIGMGYLFTRDCLIGNQVLAEPFSQKVGLYVSFWLGLVFLLYLLTLEQLALLPILGTYCAVAFGYMPGIVDRVYPWDMPALFFYTLFVCLMIRRRTIYFLPLLPLAVLFKESTGLLALAYLFGPQPLSKRLRLFLIAGALAAGAKLYANYITHSGGGMALNGKIFAANLRYIATGEFTHAEWYAFPLRRIDHPLLINAGLFAAFFIAKCKDPNIAALRCIFIVFTLLTLFMGIIFEYRIWFELIPICLYPLYCRELAEPPGGLRSVQSN